MRRLATASALCALLAGGAAAENPVVVELFTSQGCSSCPPADEILHDLASTDGVIALALHVDYWDYIGWADTFASPAYTARQQAYARVAGERTVYTPQFVVGGSDHVIGARAMELMGRIDAHSEAPSPVTLDITREGAGLVLRAEAARAEPMVVHLVRYMPEAMVEVERGENAGETLGYANIVTDWTRVGEWDGAAPLTLDLPLEGDAPVVVLIQQRGPGRILAAARLD